ncbi:oxygenase MpaB family protein [Citricoccus zhacaiensis]|uniref:oxygenase MpaB family protein n=1 Tax=Citricoccus zhacaiensis TaxID=489142 RepID=UPI003CFB4FF0
MKALDPAAILPDRLLSRMRSDLVHTFSGERDAGVPQWQLDLERGDDAGYFAHDSATWAVHGSMSTVAAGIRALLVQALHPGALAGVAEHSDYRADPLQRLAGTIRWIFSVTYGSTDAARQACAEVRRLHVPVRGRYEDGVGEERHYSANAPHLAAWVHLAFTDAFLAAHEDFIGPVPTVGGADDYVREWSVAGSLMGVQDPPTTRQQLKDRLQAFDDAGELSGGDRVTEVLGFLRNPPLPGQLGWGYRALFTAVVDTLPARYRDLLGLRATPVPRLTRAGGRATLAVVGAALSGPGPSEQAARRRLIRLGVLPVADARPGR